MRLYFCFLVFISILKPIMPLTISNKTESKSVDVDGKNKLQSVETQSNDWQKRQIKRTCPVITTQILDDCSKKALNLDSITDNVTQDLAFFKQCIVDYFCFEKSSSGDIWTKVPTFRGLIATQYFTNVAKRVQSFFVRNNVWSSTIIEPSFRNTATGQCTNLLYIIAARYLYVTYVLNLLASDWTFAPCDVDSASTNVIVPSGGNCFLAPHGSVTCTSDFDIALVGARSGSHTALFNQFFKESVGKDPAIPGFAKTVEKLLDTNVYGFTLEFAMPHAYAGLQADFVTEMTTLNSMYTFILQDLVSGIMKMRKYSRKYYNDLLSDQSEFRKRPTKHNLGAIFRTWLRKFARFGTALRSLAISDHYITEINFRRQQNIAYQFIMGIIENHELSENAGTVLEHDTKSINPQGKALSEVSIAQLYGTEAYRTRGAIRHVIGWTQMRRQDVFNKITLNDYWVSILENWADAIKEYKRECSSLLITACLPRMSKYFWRMLDAMYASRSRLLPELRQGLLEVDNDNNSGLRSIMSHWFINIKKKGLIAIPNDDRILNLPTGVTTLDYFLQAFKCSSQRITQPLSRRCVNLIHAQIRKYNQMLFIHLICSDPV